MVVPQTDGATNEVGPGWPAASLSEGWPWTIMPGFVSLDLSSVCVVDATGRIVREAMIASEPEALIIWLRGLDLKLARVGLEAGLPVELLETRHVRDAFKALAVKTDRK